MSEKSTVELIAEVARQEDIQRSFDRARTELRDRAIEILRAAGIPAARSLYDSLRIEIGSVSQDSVPDGAPR